MPTPRFTTAVEKVSPAQVPDQPNFTEEIIEAVIGPYYIVRGHTVRPLGNMRGQVGDQVVVEWQNGVPKFIVKHEVRRASPQEFLDETGPGIVEQLFLAQNKDIGTLDVWFRNYNQIQALGIGKDFATTPVKVFWGMNTDVFGVLVGTNGNEVVHVYQLDRGSKDKIYEPGKKVKVKLKLYAQALSATTAVDLITVTAIWDRNSVEPYTQLDWHPAGGVWNNDQALITRDTNINIAHVERTVTIRLTGLAISFVNGSPIPANDIVVPSPPPGTARAEFDPEALLLNENNDLIVSIKVIFADWGMWQGNSATGLTGSYDLKGGGNPVGAGICPFLPTCPHVVDAQPIQDFMDHGNPSGIISTHITETHAVVVNARLGSIVWKTLANNVTINLEETTVGNPPYRITHDTGMPAAPNGEWCYQPPDQLAPGGWRTGPGAGVPVNYDVNFGSIGDLGVIKNTGSLFDQGLSFSPDLPSGADPTPGTPTRYAVIRLPVVQSGFDQEWTDSFGSHCGPFTGHTPVALKGTWTTQSIDVFDRYTVEVFPIPFYSAGLVRSFVTVVRTAKKPVGFTSDQHQVGIFVLSGSNILSTVQPYTNVTVVNLPTLLSGNARHILWKMGADWFISDYLLGTTRTIGGSPLATLELTNPDFLYSFDEKKRFFVEGWNRRTKALTLGLSPTPASPKFPKEEEALKGLGRLVDLPKALSSADMKVNQTIADKALVKKEILVS